MKEDTICCYWISKHMTKQSIQESLHAQITRARLTVCEVGVFSREIPQLTLQNAPFPLL